MKDIKSPLYTTKYIIKVHYYTIVMINIIQNTSNIKQKLLKHLRLLRMLN